MARFLRGGESGFSMQDNLSKACLGVCIALSFMASGCGLFTLKENLEVAAAQATIEGRAGIEGRTVVVLVYSVAAAQVIDTYVLPRPASFFFVLPPGKYKLAAFEDRNRDLAYQPGDEPAVQFANPTEIDLHAGQRRAGVDLVIDANSRNPLPFVVNTVKTDEHDISRFPAPQLGTVVSLDDARFSHENAKLGLWDPLHFLTNVGAGVYFLEEYDPNKIPVLFVHGALGTPTDWKHLIGTLDRSRFQPWIAFYPTAPHLDRIAQMILRALGALQAKYGFHKMLLVAHSMGGLVTRSAMNQAVQSAGNARLVYIPAFISISSPWNGHAAAAKGAEYSPIVAPSWNDMVPDSPFLQSLPKTPLPPECEYTLLFSYRGSGGEANDGTVAVASELSMPIQHQARHVLGFNEDHDTILTNADVAALLNETLARAVK